MRICELQAPFIAELSPSGPHTTRSPRLPRRYITQIKQKNEYINNYHY